MFNKREYTAKQDLFKLLKPIAGGEFKPEVIENWYRARNYVLNILCFSTPYDGILAQDRLHFVLVGTSPVMLSIARQIALIAHYPTYNEKSGTNRTLITILYKKEKGVDNIISTLSKEEYLCNLPKLCKYTTKDFRNEDNKNLHEENCDSFIDIELELIGFDKDDYSAYPVLAKDIIIKEEDVPPYQESFSNIDIQMAKRVNMVYHIGSDIDNLPTDDPNTAERYSKALHYFCYQQAPKETQEKWDKLMTRNENGEIDQIALRNMLSNVFCSDCFESRIKAVINKEKVGLKKNEDITPDTIRHLVRSQYLFLLESIKGNIAKLAKCEHARWNVEKLILGFRPLSDEEHFEDERLFGNDRKDYRKSLKLKGIHIDLCSYSTLRRINPGDMKYDCFLMIAIPRIIKESLSFT